MRNLSHKAQLTNSSIGVGSSPTLFTNLFFAFGSKDAAKEDEHLAEPSFFIG